jgi:hypothetical protein
MGPTGTTPPPGWQVYQIAGDSGNGTGTPAWTNLTGANNIPPNPAAGTGGIPNGSVVAGGTPSTGLVVNDNPTANQVQGYNTIGSSGAANDRAIGTAPTGIAGSVIELQLTNNSGSAQAGLTVAYDIRRVTMAADAGGRSPPAGIPEGSEELPGYWLFYSLDNGANYTAVRDLIPVGEGPSSQPVVPNSVGVTTVPPTAFTFTAPWAAGSNLFLRWVDDNAIDPSPDQIYAFDNVSVAPVPEPSSLLGVSIVALLVGRTAVRRRAASRRAAAP